MLQQMIPVICWVLESERWVSNRIQSVVVGVLSGLDHIGLIPSTRYAALSNRRVINGAHWTWQRQTKVPQEPLWQPIWSWCLIDVNLTQLPLHCKLIYDKFTWRRLWLRHCDRVWQWAQIRSHLLENVLMWSASCCTSPSYSCCARFSSVSVDFGFIPVNCFTARHQFRGLLFRRPFAFLL